MYDLDKITKQVNDLMGYPNLYNDVITDDAYNNSNIEFNCILNNIRNILIYEVYLAPDSKCYNFGTRENPDNKTNAVVKDLFNKNLNYGMSV